MIIYIIYIKYFCRFFVHFISSVITVKKTKHEKKTAIEAITTYIRMEFKVFLFGEAFIKSILSAERI